MRTSAVGIVAIVALGMCVAVAGCGGETPSGTTETPTTVERVAPPVQSPPERAATQNRTGATIEPATPANSVASAATALHAVEPGKGVATEFRCDGAVVLRCGDSEFRLPDVVWVAAADAPGGDSPFGFRPRADGYYDFFFGAGTPCQFVDAATGKAVPLANVKIGIDDRDGSSAPRTVFRLTFGEPK